MEKFYLIGLIGMTSKGERAKESPVQKLKGSIFFESKLNLILLIGWVFSLGLTVFVQLSPSYSRYMISSSLETFVGLSIAYALYLVFYKLLRNKSPKILVHAFLCLFLSFYFLFLLFYTHFLTIFVIFLIISVAIFLGRKKLSKKFGLFKKVRKKSTKRKIIRIIIFGIIFSIILVISFDFVARVVWKPPNYPYKDPEVLKNEALEISEDLEDYIEGWVEGKNPAKIPDEVIPKGVDPDLIEDFRLVKPENVNPSQQWLSRKATYSVDFDELQGGLPDPHVTYLVLKTPLAPFGNKVVIEGEYPHCRFFSIQITAPFDGKSYTLRKVYGPTEVSIVDTDIPPKPGNQNPFQPNADRNVENRSYKVEIDLKTGDPVELDPDFKPPYRDNNSKHYGSLIVNQGPYWNSPIWGKGIGKWNTGLLWIRYYAPDKNKDKLGGVDLPKVHYQLPTGENYYILSDASGWNEEANQEKAAQPTKPADPPSNLGPELGWNKSFGIFRGIFLGVFQRWNKLNQTNTDYVNALDLGVTGRGEDQPEPHSYEPHATTNNYASYLGRNISLGENKVIVLTGKLPTYPKTLNGSPTLEKAQVRYWSIGTYDTNNPLSPTASSCLSSIMDEELVVDENNRYIIAYSRKSERPSNANSSNNVNWVNWGPISSASFILRWVSVMPEWSCPFDPHENNLPWEKCDLAGSEYDPSLIGKNNHKGFMGEYLPKIHYMTRQEFENLGSNITPEKIPEWKN